jgi:hypothetical protein
MMGHRHGRRRERDVAFAVFSMLLRGVAELVGTDAVERLVKGIALELKGRASGVEKN